VKIAGNSQELPPSLFLSGVDLGQNRDPAAFGGFADVFRGHFGDKEVAVKRFRISLKREKSLFYRV
jgi:hypothetical protein